MTNAITITNGIPVCTLKTGYLRPYINSSSEYPKEMLVHVVSNDKRSKCTNCTSFQPTVYKSLLSFELNFNYK